MRDVEIKREHGIYMLFVDGVFWSTCESLKDVEEELEEIEKERKVV